MSERPKVQHSKCCLVKANVGSNPTVTANENPRFPCQQGKRGFFFAPELVTPQLAIHERPLLGLLVLVLLDNAPLTVIGVADLTKSQTAP